MKQITSLITILFISLLSSSSFSETVSWDDLVERDELYYKKFSDVPFTGEVTGQWDGKFKNGKQDGLWKYYYDSGQLSKTGIYIDGKEDGLWEKYWDNGQISTRITYINGGYDTVFKHYYDNGKIQFQGQNKDGKQDGTWVFYSKKGQVQKQVDYKDGKVVEIIFPPKKIIKIEGRYLCKHISSHQNYDDKTIFQKQSTGDELKMEIFKDKVILNSTHPSKVGRMILDFERHSENIGLTYVEGFNLEGGFRNIMFWENELTSVTISTHTVFVNNYNCTPNF